MSVDTSVSAFWWLTKVCSPEKQGWSHQQSFFFVWHNWCVEGKKKSLNVEKKRPRPQIKIDSIYFNVAYLWLICCSLKSSTLPWQTSVSHISESICPFFSPKRNSTSYLLCHIIQNWLICILWLQAKLVVTSTCVMGEKTFPVFSFQTSWDGKQMRYMKEPHIAVFISCCEDLLHPGEWRITRS